MVEDVSPEQIKRVAEKALVITLHTRELGDGEIVEFKLPKTLIDDISENELRL
jgi:hypothetical protein